MPLSAVEIKKQILDRGDTVADLARRWGTSRTIVSRVIHRNSESVYPEIRKKLARYLKVPVSEVGREPQKQAVKTEAKAA
jgi:transposase-like protein